MIDVKLPPLGDSVDECLVTTWLKKEGDVVSVNEPLLEVTTDKVTIEVPADVNGIVCERLVSEGETVKIDAVICKIEEQSE